MGVGIKKVDKSSKTVNMKTRKVVVNVDVVVAYEMMTSHLCIFNDKNNYTPRKFVSSISYICLTSRGRCQHMTLKCYSFSLDKLNQIVKLNA